MIAWFATSAAAGPALPSERYELDNGLDVVLIRDPSVPLVAVDVWYHVGSKDEVTGRTGFAHLFEHLMFQGSPNQPDEYFAPLEKVGANLNGTTNIDRTNYYEVVPREFMPLALFLEADRMGGLVQTLTQDKLDNQREVVRNERRQRIENVPYGDARMVLYQSLYPSTHGYHHPTIGSHADLEAATLDDVSGFFRSWYTPNDAVLVVAGDFDPAEARKWIDDTFGKVPRGPEPARAPVVDPALRASVEVRDYRAVPQRKVWIAWHSPAAASQPDAELDLLASILGDGRDGRLVRELVEKRQVAREVAVFQGSAKTSSVFQIRATAADGHTTDEVVAAVDEVLAQVLAGAPPTAAELDAVRREYRLRYLDGLEPVLGKAEVAQTCMFFSGVPDCVAEDLARFDRATPASVVAAGAAVVHTPRVVLHILPEADRPVVAPAPAPTKRWSSDSVLRNSKKPKKPKKSKKTERPAGSAASEGGGR
ncbi:MAG: pitrilysin family protein [Myxococcota bacterium]